MAWQGNGMVCVNRPLLCKIQSVIYSTLKNFKQFFYMQQSILFNNCAPDDGPVRPETCRSYWFLYYYYYYYYHHQFNIIVCTCWFKLY
jgi:hypothetical protein